MLTGRVAIQEPKQDLTGTATTLPQPYQSYESAVGLFLRENPSLLTTLHDASPIIQTHFPNTPVILAITDELLRRVVENWQPTGRWREDMRDLGLRVHRVYLEHPQAGVLAAVLAVYLIGLQQASEVQARGAAFLALALSNLVLALADAASGGGRLFGRHRRIFWAISAALAVILALVMYVPALAQLFRIAPPPAALLGMALAAAVVGGGWPLVVRRAG